MRLISLVCVLGLAATSCATLTSAEESTSVTQEGDIFGELATPATQASTTTDPAVCDVLAASADVTVANPEISEASGAVWTSEGVWIHNDSRQDSVIYLVGAPGTEQAGQTIRTIDLSEVAPDIDDPEDIALVGTDLLLADIGDNFNTSDRDFISFYRVNLTNGELVAVYEFTYPDSSVDAEAVFVDSVTETLFVIDKQIGLGNVLGFLPNATVFSGRLSEGEVGVFETRPALREVVSIDLDELDDRSEQPLPEGRVGDAGALVTGADISADGRTVALRTYQTVWIYQSASDGSAGWFDTTPCEAPVIAEPQGEAVAIRQDADTLELLTVSEGTNQPLVRIGQ